MTNQVHAEKMRASFWEMFHRLNAEHMDAVALEVATAVDVEARKREATIHRLLCKFRDETQSASDYAACVSIVGEA